MTCTAITCGTGTLILGLALLTGAPALAGDVSVKLDAGSGFSVKDSTGAVERLRVDEATGNISRNGALFVHTTGTTNTFVGVNAGNTATAGAGRNSAFGMSALGSNTTGYLNSAIGADALRSNTTGFGNSAIGADALRSNTTGLSNTAIGQYALASSTSGNLNAAVGSGALYHNTTGHHNSAVGASALFWNGSGNYNSAVGFGAAVANTTGHDNSALGRDALTTNTTGFYNTAVGVATLRNNSSGFFNIAIGRGAGSFQTTGSNNIYIANDGVAAESGKIKIGNTAHTETFIEGISGNTATGGVAVLINSSNELHTLVSSARFKQDVRDMGDASDVLMALRPVSFRYREEAVGAEEAQVEQYGLIAEEVAEVAPELVARDLEGRPYSVQYHILPALLLNEMKKQQQTIEDQQHAIEEQRQVNADLSSRIALLEGEAGSGAASEEQTR